MIKKTLASRIGFGAVLLVAVVLAPVALAGRGGTHGSAAADPGLTVTPTSVAAGDVYHASGCGYDPGAPVNVVVYSPSAEFFFSVPVDGSGCISFGDYTSEAGQYTVNTYQAGTGNRQRLLASAQLTAY
jgi:hypothetical protein